MELWSSITYSTAFCHFGFQYTDIVEVHPSKTSYVLTDLPLNVEYRFEVSANTMIGEGTKTQVAKASPLENGKIPYLTQQNVQPTFTVRKLCLKRTL